MPAARGRHARNGHIGIADCLEFLQSMTRNDLIESGEILVEEPDKRDWAPCVQSIG